MPTESTRLTSAQAAAIATRYRELAERIVQYRDDKDAELEDDERTALETNIDLLRDKAREFNEQAVSIGLNAEKTKDAVADIKKTTKDLKDAVETLKNVNKIIGIATAAINLATAVMSGNPGNIIGAINDAINAANA